MANEIDLAEIVLSKNLILPFESIHESLSFLLLCGQIFAAFPVQGLWEKDVRKIKFKPLSLRTFMAYINILSGTIMALFCFLEFLYDGLKLGKVATFSFWVWNVFEAYYFVKLARKWHLIVNEWYQIDVSMKSYFFNRKVKRRLVIFAAVFGILAVCEHLLFILNNVQTTMHCYNKSTIEAEDYFQTAFPHVFRLIDFSIWKGVLVQLSNFWMTGLWNFADVFIVSISMAVAIRFQQLNRRLKHQYTNGVFWKNFRNDYSKLAKLCSTLDDEISPIILLSFINNLCFICIQLYNSIKPRQGFLELIYFFYSFGFLLVRILVVTLYVAWVHDESRKSLIVIHSVPSNHFDYEVSRLVHQIYTTPLGFTGSKCFLITRALLLRMTGTIVTFELMLFQFGPYFEGADALKSNSSQCS